jgi:N-acyl amino acid synthase of PEP-CTERM/exosortase system
MKQVTHSLLRSFQDFFTVRMATTAELQQETYRIRYRVYCEDMQFEASERFPDQLERDEFDEHSLHCLVTHTRTGLPAGCVRLVKAGESASLPFEKFCLDSLYTEFAQDLYERRDSICEFSRLAVDRDFRRRPGEDHTRLGEMDAMDCSHMERRSFSLIAVATTLAAFAMADLSGRGRVFGMMERHLPRLLRSSGFLMEQAGDFTEYHGRRAPYFTTVERVTAHLRPELLEFYNAIYEDFRTQISKARNVA